VRPRPYEGLLPADVLPAIEDVASGRAGVTPKRLRPRCGARTRAGGTCQAAAVWDRENDRAVNGRCRMHGGLHHGRSGLPKTDARQ
jgi:hypothetical protein